MTTNNPTPLNSNHFFAGFDRRKRSTGHGRLGLSPWVQGLFFPAWRFTGDPFWREWSTKYAKGPMPQYQIRLYLLYSISIYSTLNMSLLLLSLRTIQVWDIIMTSNQTFWFFSCSSQLVGNALTSDLYFILDCERWFNVPGEGIQPVGRPERHLIDQYDEFSSQWIFNQPFQERKKMTWVISTNSWGSRIGTISIYDIFKDFESITFITYCLFKSRMNFQQLESSVARFLWTCFGAVGSWCQVALARSASFGVAQEW